MAPPLASTVRAAAPFGATTISTSRTRSPRPCRRRAAWLKTVRTPSASQATMASSTCSRSASTKPRCRSGVRRSAPFVGESEGIAFRRAVRRPASPCLYFRRLNSDAAGDGADDEEGLFSGGDLSRQGGVGRVVREVAPAGEEANVGPALAGRVVADGAAERGVGAFERVEHGARRDRARDFQLDFALDARERAQGLRQEDADHGSACASTESTAGRSRTTAVQLSPPSREA